MAQQTLTGQQVGKGYAPKPPINYERFFVPAIGEPLAIDLVRRAALRPGERVLDVACGTGIVARLAAAQVGTKGTVAGLDVNPGMLAVAQSKVPAGRTIEWHEASAEAMPLPDESFDVVLCQMGLQFMPDKRAAMREMARVLVPGGRLLLNLPGPAPRPLAILADGLERHIGKEAGAFVIQVFSLHETGEIQKLVSGADLRDVSVLADTRSLHLPPPEEFLWQYVLSTPIAEAVSRTDDDHRDALERDVLTRWQEFARDGAMEAQVRIVIATAVK